MPSRMAELEAKVNMSLDDIIRMEKQKKANTGQGFGRNGMRGYMRGGPRNNQRGGQRNMMGNNRGNMGNMNRMNNNMYRMNNNKMYRMNNNMMRFNNMNNRNNNRRGQWRRYPQNNMYGGYFQKRYYNENNGPINQNLRRSRSSMSLNRMNGNRGGPRGGYSPYRGGRFPYSRSRSRSRTNLAYTQYTPQNDGYESNSGYQSDGYLQRTNSLPDLRDSSSVYTRLGYQQPNEAGFRNRVKRTKTSIIQKNLKMQNALQLMPTGKNGVPVQQRQRRYSIGSVMTDQIVRAQRRAQYEQKLMRINSRAQTQEPIDYMSSLTDYALKRPTLSTYSTSPQSQKSLSNTPRRLRGKSFSRSLQNLSLIPKAEPVKVTPRRNQRRGRSRSRSRVRAGPPPPQRNSVNIFDGDLDDRSFSEVMYSLSNNFGVTGQTLNDRFSIT